MKDDKEEKEEFNRSRDKKEPPTKSTIVVIKT